MVDESKREKERRIRSFIRGSYGSVSFKKKAHQIAFEYLGAKCLDCGYSKKNPSYYDFHHIDESLKSFQITQKLSKMGFERIRSELDKCVLLCVVCHRKRHAVGKERSKNSNSVRVRRLSAINRELAFLAKGSRCERCGFSEKNLFCYDYHHNDPSLKSKNLALAWGHSDFEWIADEIASCSLLCANCHREIHVDKMMDEHRKKIRLFGRCYVLIGGDVFVVHSNDTSVRHTDDGDSEIRIKSSRMIKYTEDGKRLTE